MKNIIWGIGMGIICYAMYKLGYADGCKESYAHTTDTAPAQNDADQQVEDKETKNDEESLPDESPKKGRLTRWFANHKIAHLVNIVRHPEKHQMEVTMDGEDTVVRIKKREKNCHYNE